METQVVGSFLKAPGRVVRRVRTGTFMNMVSVARTPREVCSGPAWLRPAPREESVDVSLVENFDRRCSQMRTDRVRAGRIPTPNHFHYPTWAPPTFDSGRADGSRPVRPGDARIASPPRHRVKKPSGCGSNGRIRREIHPNGCIPHGHHLRLRTSTSHSCITYRAVEHPEPPNIRL